MSNARLLLNYVRVAGEPINAKHDVAAGPVLGHTDMAGIDCDLSPKTRAKEKKPNTQHCQHTGMLRHIYLQLQSDSVIVAAFERGTDN
jgi:hypothetical protein